MKNKENLVEQSSNSMLSEGCEHLSNQDANQFVGMGYIRNQMVMLNTQSKSVLSITEGCPLSNNSLSAGFVSDKMIFC